jgi:protein tyrosine/serine phosphatase
MRRPYPGSGVVVLLSTLVLSGCFFQTSPRVEPRPTAWAEHIPSQHLKNWHKLDEDVYRSEQPGRKGFIEIRDRGIKTVVNLRSHHSDDSKAAGLGLVLVRVPMTAAGFSEADIVAALKAIQSAAKPVLIHCQRGADRAGVVSAMYRVVFQDWSREEAIAELQGGGFGFASHYKHIPRFIREVDVDRIRKELGLRPPLSAGYFFSPAMAALISWTRAS